MEPTTPPAHPWWPVWNLRICTERLELRPVREAEAHDLVELAGRGVHDPATMPFSVAWTDLDSPERERCSYAFYMRCWADLVPGSWRVPFAAYRDGACIGTADLVADDFAVLRTVTTGSWVGRASQGIGLGKELRAAMLHLAFDGLGALRAQTSAWQDNAASLGVTRSLGYRACGDHLDQRRGERHRLLEYAMEEPEWEASPARSMPVEVNGVDAAVLAQLGVPGATSSPRS